MRPERHFAPVVELTTIGGIIDDAQHSRLGREALGVTVAVVSSAVLTCVPDAMSNAIAMPGCGGMHEAGARLSAELATNCCVRHEPFLTVARVDLRQAPLRRLASAASVSSCAVVATRVAQRAQTPPGLTSTLGPPVYITLATLRI